MNNLLRLVQKIGNHEATNNFFYQKWLHTKLTAEKIAVFARNYWELTYRFPEALAALIQNIDNVYTRTEYTKTLYSEMGNGDPKRVHAVLFEDFCNDLFRNLGYENSLSMDFLKRTTPLLSQTIELIKWQRELYSKEYAVAAGAQLALEWQAYTMITQLYDGARNYIDLWPTRDKFHESCEFFYVHIGAAEKEHKNESITAALKITENGGEFSQIELGFNKHLELLASFWNAIASEMDNTNSPIICLDKIPV